MWTRDEWINDWCEKYPGCSEDVLGLFMTFVIAIMKSPLQVRLLKDFSVQDTVTILH